MTDETRSLPPSAASREVRLEELLADILRRESAGEAIDRQALAAAHPELARDLGQFFANRAHLERLVGKPPADAAATAAEPRKVRYFGDYELQDEIAHGGMGIVYHARQMSLNRPVAVKMILAGQLANESDVKRFLAEAEAAANLRHPGVVPIYEIGIHEGQHYYSMEYIEGRTLSQLVRENSLSAAKAAEYVREMAEIVHYAHGQGVLHRDLKPSNVLIDTSDRVRITDFGLAKRVAGGSDLTITGQVIGTPSYMPPEQAAAQHAIIGAASDVYSLGAILYELITGRPPFRSENIAETLRQVQHDDPVRPRLLSPRLPRDLETICLKCLEKEPRRRYASAQQLADELGRFLRGEPVQACPPSLFYRLRKFARRNRLIVIALSAIGVAMLSAILILAIAVKTITQEHRKTKAAMASETKAYDELTRALARERESVNSLRLASARHHWVTGDFAEGRKQLLSCPAELRNREWRLLERLLNAESLALAGHTSNVHCLTYSSDGRLLASASQLELVVWEVSTGQQLYTIPSDVYFCRGLAFSKDGRQITSLSWTNPRLPDGTKGKLISEVGCWRLENPAAPTKIHSQQYVPMEYRAALCPSGEEIVTVAGTELVARHVLTGHQRSFRHQHSARIHSFAFSQDGRYFASASGDNVQVWDFGTGELMRSFSGIKDTQNYLNPAPWALSADAARFCWGVTNQFSKKAELQLLSAAANRPARQWEGDEMDHLCIRFSPNGRYLATAGRGKTLTIWDTEIGREWLTLRLPMLQDWFVYTMEFSPDGKHLATGDHSVVRVWDVSPL